MSYLWFVRRANRKNYVALKFHQFARESRFYTLNLDRPIFSMDSNTVWFTRFNSCSGTKRHFKTLQGITEEDHSYATLNIEGMYSSSDSLSRKNYYKTHK